MKNKIKWVSICLIEILEEETRKNRRDKNQRDNNNIQFFRLYVNHQSSDVGSTMNPKQ